MTAVTLDHQRKRWDEARRLDRLNLEDAAGFATGGLGGLVEALDVRIRFLPADPLATPVRLDGEAEEWLSNPRSTPYGGHEPELGRLRRATSSALLRYDQYRDNKGWTRFVGLHRDGGLDFGQGSSTTGQPDSRVVWLRPLVGLTWHLASMQIEAIERWSIAGPFEVSVALAGVEGARLGGFAEGWRDVGDIFYRDALTCVERNVLLRVECDILEPEALAMQIGEQLENTFGTTNRRFIANRGDYEARFDPRY